MTTIPGMVDVDEINRYQEGVQAFLDEEMDADRFMAFRLQHGIYGQRQDGKYMMRVKLPGGRLGPTQLNTVADVLERWSDQASVHITTRQDIQIHYISIQDTPAIMRQLAHAGLTSREGCGNTVRNITSCALSGSCPKEHADMQPFLQAAVHRFLRNPLTQQLPRKFKMSLSGCEQDCAQGIMHDVGMSAQHRDGKFGFRIVAGGGLGHKPRQAILVEDFISEEELLPCLEALIALHNRYSDRKRRAKSRIKFLVERFGAEGFLEKYREELSRTRAAWENEATPKGEWSPGVDISIPGLPRQITVQKQENLHIVPISVEQGDLSAAQLRGLATLMQEIGLEDIRTTQEQNLLLLNVPTEQLEHIAEQLIPLNLSLPQRGDNVVICAGTSTCRMGITASRVLGGKINGGEHDLRLRVSGCQNGCAQPEIGDIGIFGEGKRLYGRLVPHYQMFFGGNGLNGGSLAMKGLSIPAALITTAIQRIQKAYGEERQEDESFYQWSHRRGLGYLDSLVADLKEVQESDIGFLARDHGEEQQFKVLQFGGGECAGADQGIVAANFSEAAHERNYRNAFLLQRKHGEALVCAREVLRLIGESLLYTAGKELPDNLDAIAATPAEVLGEHGFLLEQLAHYTQEIHDQLQVFREADFKTMAKEMDSWIWEAARACQQMDKQLDLTASLPAWATPPAKTSSAA